MIKSQMAKDGHIRELIYLEQKISRYKKYLEISYIFS